ncbi:hypothetical protein DL765_008013 [Monosporascus sp. GIB2]|nr:hypothetical protein DL765_008013 [Monosporascus sp. GIB2]
MSRLESWNILDVGNKVIRKKPKWPNLESSMGTKLGMKGNYTYWEAKGPARQAYDELCPQIARVLTEDLGTVDDSDLLLYQVFLVGRSPEKALPHIMFSSPKRETRTEARKIIIRSGILNNYPGMQVGEWASAPHIGLQFQMGLGDDKKAALQAPMASSSRLSKLVSTLSEGTPAVDLPHDPWRLVGVSPLGRGIARFYHLESRAFKFSIECSSLSQTATCGAVFVHNGRAYGLVPAHVLLPGPIHPDVGALSDEGVEDLEGFTFGDFGEDSDGDQDLDHEAVSTGLGSLSPRTEYPASEDELFEAYHGMIPESAAHDGNPMFGESHHSDRDRKINKDGDSESLLDACLVASIDLDYALLELEFDPLLSLAEIPILDISPQSVAPIVGECRIQVLTASNGLVRGTLYEHDSLIRLPGSTTFQKVYGVDLEKRILRGDCGSVVRDRTTGDVYGHIITGSAETSFAFIIPATTVLSDAMWRLEKVKADQPTTFAGSTACQTLQEREGSAPMASIENLPRGQDSPRVEYRYLYESIGLYGMDMQYSNSVATPIDTMDAASTSSVFSTSTAPTSYGSLKAQSTLRHTKAHVVSACIQCKKAHLR